MERHSLKEFLLKHLHEETIPQLKWIDKDKLIFQVPWPQKDSRQVLDPNPFTEWAKLNRRNPSEFTQHKHVFRAALLSATKKTQYLKLIDSKLVNSEGYTVKIYQFKVSNGEANLIQGNNGNLLNDVLPQEENRYQDLHNPNIQTIDDLSALATIDFLIDSDMEVSPEYTSPSTVTDTSPLAAIGGESPNTIMQNSEDALALHLLTEEYMQNINMEKSVNDDLPSLQAPVPFTDQDLLLITRDSIEADKYKLNVTLKIKSNKITDVEIDNRYGCVISPYVNLTDLNSDPATRKEIPANHKWVKSIPFFVTGDNINSMSEESYKRYEMIHDSMLRGFGFRCSEGNIFSARRCKASVVCTNQNEQGKTIKLERPQRNDEPFTDHDTDKEIFNLEKFFHDFQSYLNKERDKPFPGIKFCVGAKIIDAGNISEQLINGEIISVLAKKILQCCKKSDGENSSLCISKSNEGDNQFKWEITEKLLKLSLSEKNE